MIISKPPSSLLKAPIISHYFWLVLIYVFRFILCHGFFALWLPVTLLFIPFLYHAIFLLLQALWRHDFLCLKYLLLNTCSSIFLVNLSSIIRHYLNFHFLRKTIPDTLEQVTFIVCYPRNIHQLIHLFSHYSSQKSKMPHKNILFAFP